MTMMMMSRLLVGRVLGEKVKLLNTRQCDKNGCS